MNDEMALISSCISSRGDLILLAVYSDWLEENYRMPPAADLNRWPNRARMKPFEPERRFVEVVKLVIIHDKLWENRAWEKCAWLDLGQNPEWRKLVQVDAEIHDIGWRIGVGTFDGLYGFLSKRLKRMKFDTGMKSNLRRPLSAKGIA